MTTDSNVLAVSPGLRSALGYYRLVAEIGRGGMANVFLALFPKGDGTSRHVVLKQLRSELVVEEEFRTMFENEARLATRFQHTNVVQTYDIYSDRDLCVLVMEFLDGQTLSRVRQRAMKGSYVPFSVHLRVLSDALAGLHYVHELSDERGQPLGIVHRDVTPSNIFVGYDGQAKVVDFGIAKATHRETETRAGAVKGKLGYMSPEALRNERLDRRSDIFSVGVMLWEAATGRRLWQEHDELAVFRRLAAGDLPIQVPEVQGTAAEMLRVAERALAVDPSRRYATADEMRRDVEEVLARLAKTTQLPELTAYMDAFFGVDRKKLQTIVAEALVRFPPKPVSQRNLLRNEVSDSYPGVDLDPEPPTRISSPPTSGGTFRTANTSYDIAPDDVENADDAKVVDETPHFRPSVRRGVGYAVVAAAAALGVAYAAHAPIDAPAHAAAKPMVAETAAADDEMPASPVAAMAFPAAASAPPVAATALAVTANAPPPLAAPPLAPPPVVPGPALAPPPVVPAPPEPTFAGPAAQRGTISAVFVVHPTHARLFLDGVPLEGNPAGFRRPPDDKPHLLRAEAPGYATLVRIVDLDRDLAKELDLVPEGAGAPRIAPSTEPNVEAPKPHPAKRAARDDPWGI
jgi:serine/threonine-protein kinase